jgi:hypothetical protein
LSSYRSKYSTTGPVSRIQFDGVDALNALLRDETLVRMARKLAVGLLRKGGGMFARFHDYNLADDLFSVIDARSTDASADASAPQDDD